MATIEELREAARQAPSAATGATAARSVPSDDGPASVEQLRQAARATRPEARPEHFVNQGIARSLGAPVDLANELLGLVGLDSEQPLGGSASLEAAMDFLGRQIGGREITPPKGAQPDTAAESVARGVGDAAGGLLPFGTAARLAGRGAGALAQAGRAATETMARRPATSLAAEAGMGAASGAGGQAATELFADTEEARALGELAGGFGAGAVGTAVRAIPSVWLVRKAGKAAGSILPGAGPRRARERLRGLSPDPDEAARAQGRETIAELTPAQRTGEKRFLELEKTARADDPEFDERIAQHQARANQQLQTEARGIGQGRDVGEARRFFERRVQQALDRVNGRLKNLTPQKRENEASRIVREEIDRALQGARQREGQLFARVPKDVEVPTETTRETFASILRDQDIVDDPENVPDFLQNLIGQLDDAGNLRPGNAIGQTATVDRLQRLRSRVLEAQRAERAKEAPNRRRLAVLSEVQDAILDDLGAKADDVRGEAGQALRDALDFSRQVNERFMQGSVGRVLGFERRGGPSVRPEEVLETTVGRAGTRGAAATDELLRAVEDAPTETRRQIEDFIKNRFQRAAVRDGEVNAERAREFIERNRELLDRFPETARAIDDVAQGQKDLRALQKSAVGRFADAAEGEEIRQVLRARNPRQSARELVEEARRQGSEVSLSGLKAGVIDTLLEGAKTRNFDEAGQALISGGALRAQMADKRLAPVIEEVLDKADRDKLARVLREFETLERAQRARTRPEGVMNDVPNSLLNTAARVAGAFVGGKLGQSSAGGSLQTAQIFSGRARDLVKRLTTDRAEALIRRALEPGNEELFKTLVMGFERNPKAVNQRLNAWLAGPGSDLLEGEDAEATEPSR